MIAYIDSEKATYTIKIVQNDKDKHWWFCISILGNANDTSKSIVFIGEWKAKTNNGLKVIFNYYLN